MPLTAFRILFRKDTDAMRFGPLARLLDAIQGEISTESAELRSSGERMTDCAAFSFEAMENGENPGRMSSKIDNLSRQLAFNRGRQALLERQMSFLERTRAELARIFHSHRK
ncbi:hypothetical protein ACG873_00770 (plasmid) [Mesorhizobium sp. AaZ16]|uniref:hypothetical protein n=1 Tax=Mesorhizobium sp. AaZ16 TaxID=3402289 RepID=UPI00374F7826